MAQGDRVVIGDGYVWQDNGQSVMVYEPVFNEKGQIQQTPDGSTIVQSVGGVLIGSTGTIHGNPINAHRSYLHNHKDYPTGLGNDLVQLVPIMLDKYQRVGWFPIDNFRIYSGSPI